jgi:D-alanyl-D-alanine carboxypeptidase/D-alanyl-D-alanine-endopeptidase (penicillin-binding protein 4)
VAAFSGTLADRFGGATPGPGAGLVRAKTGTLMGVTSLAGVVADADGRLLVFAFLADAVPATGMGRARVVLDRIGATLAACGCR